MYNDFVASNNLLGNTTLHNRYEGVTNRRSDQQYDDTSEVTVVTVEVTVEVTVKCVI